MFVQNPSETFTEVELNDEIKGDKMNGFTSNDCLKKMGDKLVLN